jgi:sugar (pentulose or hexulose) kinase
MESAGEGGAWGIALLAAYAARKDAAETLEDFLAKKVFAHSGGVVAEPDPADRQGFAAFMKRYEAGLAIERVAAEHLN